MLVEGGRSLDVLQDHGSDLDSLPNIAVSALVLVHVISNIAASAARTPVALLAVSLRCIAGQVRCICVEYMSA